MVISNILGGIGNGDRPVIIYYVSLSFFKNGNNGSWLPEGKEYTL
jgi:hypothetical protein